MRNTSKRDPDSSTVVSHVAQKILNKCLQMKYEVEQRVAVNTTQPKSMLCS